MRTILERVKERWWLVTVAVIVIGAAFYYGYGGIRDDGADTSGTMETAKASRGDVRLSVTGSGQVLAASQVDLRPQVAGDGLDIVRIAVGNDQEVKKGDLIAVLDYSDAQRSLRTAELSLWSARIRMDQTEKTNDSRTEDDRRIRQLQEASVRQAEVALENAREKLDDYFIRAPFDGVVTGLSAEAGDSISRTETLASVITRELVVAVSLNEVDVALVSVGDAATITLDAFEGVSIPGVVAKMDTIGTVSQNVVYYGAEIDFTGELPSRLKPGMSASVEIAVDSSEGVVVVPAVAVRSDLDGEYVYIVPGSSTEDPASPIRTSVTTGLSDGVVTEIVSGIEIGAVVATKLPTASAVADSGSQGLFDSAIRAPGSSRR